MVNIAASNPVDVGSIPTTPAICLNCGISHDGSYGSGRFCSKKCARSFSTKNKRDDINKAVSKKLKGKKINSTRKNNIKIHQKLSKVSYIKECPCGKTIETFSEKKKYCSIECSHRYSQLGLSKKKGKDRKIGSGGIRENGGRCKQQIYITNRGESIKLNNDEIIIASLMDKYDVDWKRNWKGFSYINAIGESKKYYPDFVIDEKIYVEYKGWVTEEMRHKMKDSMIRNNINLLIVVGKDPRYKNDGISIEEFEDLLKNKSFHTCKNTKP